MLFVCSSSGVFKVIATDYYHSVIYKCREIDEDGTCRQGHEFVDIIGRTKTFPSAHVQQKLFSYTRLLCKERGEFVPNDLTGESTMHLFEDLYSASFIRLLFANKICF